MVKDQSDSERKPAAATWATLSDYMHHPIDGIVHTSRGALAGTRNSSMGPPHEGSMRRPIAP